MTHRLTRVAVVSLLLFGTLATGEARQKTKPAQPANQNQPAAKSSDSGEAPSPIEEEEAELNQKWKTQESPVPYQRNFDDKQDAAVRPGEYTLDPKFRGFIPIPHTVFMVKFNPKPRVDLTLDNNNSGDDFRFVPALIPVDGDPTKGGGARFNANGNGTQLRVDIRAPAAKGNLRFYYQNDFFGSDTSNFKYRLQHAYGSGYGFTAGFTYGVFEDPDAWPDTLDYEGPNATNFARRPLLHYTALLSDAWNMTFGLEDPDFFLDNSGNPDATTQKRMPDIGFNARWEPKGLGHMQLSTIFRMVGAHGGVFPSDSDFGWGVNLSGAFDVTKKDMLLFLGNFGYGIGGMGNDTSFVNSDAAFDAAGNIVALRYFSGLFGYTHKWTPRWRSTATYGYANLQNTDGQPGGAYHFTHYASGNLIYQIFKRLSIGAEGLFGFKEVKDGSNGDVFRGQVTIAYSLFD
jgi:outer membrane DcaP-like protein